MSVRVIRVQCGLCGWVEVRRETVRLYLAPERPAIYTFVCSSCNMPAIRTAPQQIITLLGQAGVRPEPAPAEISEHPADDEPLTEDDLIEFGQALEAADLPVGALLGPAEVTE